MPTTLPGSAAVYLPGGDHKPAVSSVIFFAPVLFALLLPILLFLISAAIVGHGQISWESMIIVLQVGNAGLCLDTGACLDMTAM